METSPQNYVHKWKWFLCQKWWSICALFELHSNVLVKGYVATVTAIVATSCIKKQNLVAILQSDCVAYLAWYVAISKMMTVNLTLISTPSIYCCNTCWNDTSMYQLFDRLIFQYYIRLYTTFFLFSSSCRRTWPWSWSSRSEVSWNRSMPSRSEGPVMLPTQRTILTFVHPLIVSCFNCSETHLFINIMHLFYRLCLLFPQVCLLNNKNASCHLFNWN